MMSQAYEPVIGLEIHAQLLTKTKLFCGCSTQYGNPPNSPSEAVEFLQLFRVTLQYLEICDGNMEEGSLRCDANLSVRKKGSQEVGVKSEIKNLNSFRFLQKVLEYESQRQIELIEEGKPVLQETRLWDSRQNKTLPMRSKEEAHDYRYFPEPDLPPLVISEELINKLLIEILDGYKISLGVSSNL